MNPLPMPQDRREFLKWAGLVGAFVPIALTGCATSPNDPSLPSARLKVNPPSSSPPATPNDIKILQDALALEHKGIAAYTAGINSGLLDTPTTAVATKFRGHHEQHRNKLSSTILSLGAKPVEAPAKYDDFPLMTSQTDILKFAASIEETAAFAYSTAAGDLSDHGLIVAAISIVGCEAWHTAVLRGALGQDPAPTAFLQ